MVLFGKIMNENVEIVDAEFTEIVNEESTPSVELSETKQILDIIIADKKDLLPLVYKDTGSYIRSVTEEVSVFGNELVSNINKLKATMKKYNGYGLAAPQVGIDYSYFVFNTDPKKEIKCIINPRIENVSDPVWSNEGCLSIPTVSDKVLRFRNIKLTYQDETGKEHTEDFSDADACCIQHEIDHLKGILFIDRLSKLKRNMLIKKYMKNMLKFKRQYESLNYKLLQGDS